MGFVEFIFDSILVIAVVAAGLAAVATIGGAFLIALIAALCLGWIPIAMCATDAEWAIGMDGDSFVEQAAAWATILYLLTGAGLCVLWLTVADSDGLPHGLKSLAFLFPHPAEPHVQRAITTGQRVDGRAMARAMRSDVPTTRTGKRIYAHNARSVAKDNEAETERLKANQELVEATAEMERARERLNEARKRVRK